MAVPARISLITLGVADVARSTRFYVALGWKLSPASMEGDVSFFRTGGAILGLWGTADLAADAKVELPTGGFRGMSVAINLASAGEVDEALATAVRAGGTLAKAGQKTDWGGYSGYFADPDGHLWEVAHNPYWPLGTDGLPQLP